MALTVKKIASLKPRSDRYEVADGGGLYLVVHPSGKKSWALRYRAPGSGLARKLTFGEIDAPTARDRAARARNRIKLGFDPASEAIEAKARARDRSNLVTDLMDTYLADYARTHRTSTHAEVARLFDRWARPAIGSKRVEDVAQADIQAILGRMAKAGAPSAPTACSRPCGPSLRPCAWAESPCPICPPPTSTGRPARKAAIGTAC